MNDLTRQEVDAKLAAAAAKVETRLINFDSSVQTGFSELRAEIATLQGEMHKIAADIIKWGVVTALGFATLTMVVLTFVITSTKQPTPPPIAAAPLVINLPAPAPVSVPTAPAPSPANGR